MPDETYASTTPGPYEPTAYWEALLSRSFDTSGVAYAYLAVSFNEALYRAERDQVRRAFARWKPAHPIASALDVGCGIGIWIEFWDRLGVKSITGVDLTETSIDRLRDRGVDAALIRADIGDAELELGGPFDVISAMSVLLHIVDPERFSAAVANLARHLAPHGRMFLIEPVVVDRWWGGEYGPDANSRARTLEAWISELERHGLDVLELRPVTFLLANPIDARRGHAFRLWLRYWSYVLRFVGRRERVGAVAGRVLELVDRPLRRSRRTGPSAKLLVVRHKGGD